jgi:hypothetical protein
MAWSDAARAAAIRARQLRRKLGPLQRGGSERSEVNRIIRLNRKRVGSIESYHGALSHISDARRVAARTPRVSNSLSAQLKSSGKGHGLTASEAARRRKLRGR